MCFYKNIKISSAQVRRVEKLTDAQRSEWAIKHFFQVAKKDIKVIKVVCRSSSNSTWQTFCRGFRLHKGVHYYQKGIKFGVGLYSGEYLRIDKGLHSYNPRRITCDNSTKLDAIIPKGSYHIKNSDGEYVSDNLIILGRKTD